MGGIKFKIHPLFYVLGVYYALSGKIAVFVIYTVCAVIHELGHSFVAENNGYKLNKITLMPFGAVVSGNIDGLKPKDEFKIALAGPFTNLAVGLLFVAFWWIYPELYAYTDIVAEASFTMALMNFIPVFPLDGGRVLSSVISQKHGKEKAYKICKWLGVVFAIILFAFFLLSLFVAINLSLLFFSLFVLFGAFDKQKENKYVRITSEISNDRLVRGVSYKKHGIDKNVTVKKLISILDAEALNEVVVFDNGKEIAVLSQSKLTQIAKTGDLYAPISKYLGLI